MTWHRLGCILLIAGLSTIPVTSCSPATSISRPPTVPATVVAVVDGDTIDVRTSGGEKTRVRLIGLDSPEIGRDGAPDECYAVEARDWLDAYLYGRHVQLEADPTQENADRYGRLLRHVYLDGRSAALGAIRAGAAYEYTFDVPYQHQDEHVSAEATAQRDKSGLWAVC